MKLEERIDAFVRLGEEFSAILNGNPSTEAGKRLQEMLPGLAQSNGWYTEENVRHRLETLAKGLSREVMEEWLKNYSIPEGRPAKTVGVILAGNIPLVGFDDFRCVLIAGHRFLGKASSDDKKLLPLVADMLKGLEPRFEKSIVFEENQLKGMDAVIATGSTNSSRYFEHYFSKFPHIIRRNRNGIAILTGKETTEELEALGEDIFRYFGLGCRNVTKLFVPHDYSFHPFFESIFKYGETMMQSKKYMNNYEYHKTLYLLNSLPLLDNNFLLLKEDIGLASPPGVIFYERYETLPELLKKIYGDRELVQCVVAKEGVFPGGVAFGQSQVTGPADYADGVDVMKFLLEL